MQKYQIQYNELCDRIQELVNYELRDYKRFTLSALVSEVAQDLQKAESYIKQAKDLVKEHGIRDDSRLTKLIKRL
jgi:hypothetical protein